MSVNNEYNVDISFTFNPPGDVFEKVEKAESEPHLYDLKLQFCSLSLLRGLEELLCLDSLNNVDKYWYQVETAKRAIRDCGGRVILADEVGLGKTIEAGMIIKEYLMRGMVSNILVLTPPSLVSQWQEEMSTKFDLNFVTTDRVDPAKDESFWSREKLIIASINVAKAAANFDRVIATHNDLVVVDEVHHLKNRHTLNWKLVNDIKSRFILLLSATPVQNNLVELYNLITLLKPGLLRTESQFKREYVKRGDPRTPLNRDKLRALMREVMIRNTRSVVDLKLPRRFASTIVVPPSDIEREIYNRTSLMVRTCYASSKGAHRMMLNTLLREAGSSPYALKKSLRKLDGLLPSASVTDLLDLADRLDMTEKERYLLELLGKSKGKKIVFVSYLETLSHLANLLAKSGFTFTEFRGNMTGAEKGRVIESFRGGTDILLSTESGGEGINVQFCNTMINYDLPWNPMRIEQRIGRIHRIGQTRDVFIFNLCVDGSIEHRILDVLDKKINMFELVIGEMDAILGNLSGEEDFEELVMGIWVRSQSDIEAKEGFERLGEDMMKAKQVHEETKQWDDILFGNDLEV